MVALDTRDILFIVGGAFNGLDQQISDRTATASIGFGSPIRHVLALSTHRDHAKCESRCADLSELPLLAFGSLISHPCIADSSHTRDCSGACDHGNSVRMS